MKQPHASSSRVLPVLKVAGAFIAFLFGSGFATGQEVMQFFVSHGVAGVAGALLFMVLCSYLSVTLLLAGQKHRFRNIDEVFRHFAGNVIGRLFSWYTTILLFSVYALMLAGAGSVLHEHLAVPVYVGSGLLATVILFSLLFGLRELIDIIGSIGPILALFVVYISVKTLMQDPGAVAIGDASIGDVDMLSVSANWWTSGLLYAAFNVYGLFSFLPSVGTTVENRKALIIAAFLGPLIYSSALIVAILAMVSLLPEIGGRLIPMLHLVNYAAPGLASVFAWVVLAGILTTTAPILWIVLVRFTPDGSRHYRWLALSLTVAGLAGSQLLPFDRMVNLIYPTVGYFGVILIVLVIVRHIRTRSLA